MNSPHRSEDIAFSIMLNKPMPELASTSSLRVGGLDRLTGYGSDHSAEEEQPQQSRPSAAAAQAPPADEQQLTDWDKMACLLCQRQFPSREKLQK